MKRLSALVLGAILLSCAARVGAWAQASREHDCCAGEGRKQAPSLLSCCPAALGPAQLRVSAGELLGLIGPHPAAPALEEARPLPVDARPLSPASFLPACPSRAPPLG